MCRDDRKKDRYGESVTVPIGVREGGQRQIMETETGMRDGHKAHKGKMQMVLCDKERDVNECLNAQKQ